MTPQIITKPFQLDIYGFSGIAPGNDYAATAFALSDKLWKKIKADGIKNKGKNVWVYEPNNVVFTGVELDSVPEHDNGLEQKSIVLTKYAYYKHVGPYRLIKRAGQTMQTEIKSKGFETRLPYIEIYGHWTGDETKAETELFMALV